MAAEISATSLELVGVPVKGRAAGVDVNPTTGTVQLAFVRPHVVPAAGDWKTASWETDTGRFLAQSRVGPGGVVSLQPGIWAVWLKLAIGAGPTAETVVRRSGTLHVTA